MGEAVELATSWLMSNQREIMSYDLHACLWANSRTPKVEELDF